MQTHLSLVSSPIMKKIDQPGGIVLKILNKFMKSSVFQINGQGLPVSLCDSHFKLLGLLTPEAISGFERYERKRITLGLEDNCDIIVYNYKIKFLNDWDVFRMYEKVQLRTPERVQHVFDGDHFKRVFEMDYLPRFAIMEITEFKLFNRDSVRVSNDFMVPFVYFDKDYQRLYCEVGADSIVDRGYSSSDSGALAEHELFQEF